MPELLPRFYRRMQELEDLRKLGRILEEAGEAPETNAKPLRRSADGHDPARLRDLPAIRRTVRVRAVRA